ncbi:MAG TPA: type 1 glutamine amidotransferase family protein [Candidatus Acidoferrum sp.]|nr:type 1 glutamine amidotransferase family protein [Candidatus Acidoferrum sp.]
MLPRTAFVLLRSGFADWEAASALAELRRTFEYSVKTIGLSSQPVVSMGGFEVTADLSLSEFVPESASILILPGGDAWTEGELAEVSHAVRAMVALSRPVAAICAATLALAHAGLLDDRLHTSNGKGFIEKHVPEYRGQNLYRPLRSVRDKCVVTANGLAPFAFAAEIFRALVPEREEDIEIYENLYSRGLLDN